MIRTTAESHLRKKTGEELQHWLRDKLRKQPFVTDPSMIQSQKMSAHGEDILMHDEVRSSLPVSFECKKAKSGFAPAYNALQQAVRQVADMASTKEITPIAIIQQDGFEPIAVLRTDDLFKVFLANMENEEEEENANDVH